MNTPDTETKLARNLALVDARMELARKALTDAFYAMQEVTILKSAADHAALVVDLEGERQVLRGLLQEVHTLLVDLLETEDSSESRHRLHRLRTQIEDAVTKIFSPVEKRLRALPPIVVPSIAERPLTCTHGTPYRYACEECDRPAVTDSSGAPV